MFILRNYRILTGGSATVTNTATNKQDSKTALG